MKYLLALFITLLFSNAAMADLLVTPSRIVFEPRERTQEVILLNTSNERKSYSLEWITQSQGVGGRYEELKGEDQDAFATAAEFIRFSPRRITLEPGENQKVKLMLRRKSDMPLKEYRSHLKFTALPNSLTGANASTDAQEENAEGFKIKLNLLLSYTIPVVLRTEEAKPLVNINTIKLEKGDSGQYEKVWVEIEKPSENSVYGDFTIFHEDGDEVNAIGFLNGVNIFAENKVFKRHINFVTPFNANSGDLRIQYKGKAEFTDKLFAEAKIAVN